MHDVLQSYKAPPIKISQIEVKSQYSYSSSYVTEHKFGLNIYYDAECIRAGEHLVPTNFGLFIFNR